MISNKITQFIPNLILMTILTVLLLVPPLVSMVLVFGSNQPSFQRDQAQQNVLGLEITASPEDFGNNLRYLDDSGGTIKTVGFVSKPGEAVLYRDIFELQNVTVEDKTYEIKILKVWGSNVESKELDLYFGENERQMSVTLDPGQKATVNLKVLNLNLTFVSADYNFLKFAIF